MSKILLCCDLDRTVLPNGNAIESPGARELFAGLIQKAGLMLAYVSGRNLEMLKQAIEEYQIPVPDFAIGDVGTTLYQIDNGQWQVQSDWELHIAQDWHQHHATELQQELSDLPFLHLQEAENQSAYKLSYYADLDHHEKKVTETIQQRLTVQQIKANIIYSIDEIADIGLVDILPARASKFHAIEFLIERLETRKQDTLFAGDSGNDLPVLTSDIPAVLVNNAIHAIKSKARQLADANGLAQQLYLARGGFYGLNGNYCSGIIEGLAHYHPELRSLITKHLTASRQ